MSRKFLVTGGTGFIGRRVCRNLLEREIPVVVLDANLADRDVQELQEVVERKQLPADHLSLVQADVADLADLEDAFTKHRGIEQVIHLAYVLTAAVEENPALGARVNVVGTANLLEACARRRAKRVILISSEAVYGCRQERYGQRPVREGDFCAPDDHHFLYGVMKLLNEFMGRKYAQQYDLEVACLRPSIVFGYGRGAGAQGWAEAFASNPAVGKPITLPFPADNRDNWIYVEDCAEQLVRLALKPQLKHYVYNSGGYTATAESLAEQIREHLPDAEITFDDSGPHTPLIDELDGRRLEGEIGFSPRSLSAGLLAHINEARQAAGLARLSS